MRKLALVVLFFLAVSVELALALTGTKKSGLYVTTHVVYEKQSLHLKIRQAEIFESLQTWSPLTDASQGVTVLGRITDQSEDHARFELIVVDTTKAAPFVISNIHIDTTFGEKATSTVITDAGAVVKISITAHPTEFTEFHVTDLMEKVARR